MLTREILSLIVRRQTSKNLDWDEHPLLGVIIIAFQNARQRSEIVGDPLELVKLFFTAILGFFAGHDAEENHRQARHFIEVFLRGIAVGQAH